MGSAWTASRLTVFSWNIMDNQCRCSVSQKTTTTSIIKLLNKQHIKCGLAVGTDRYCFMSMTKPLETTEAMLKLFNLIIQKRIVNPAYLRCRFRQRHKRERSGEVGSCELRHHSATNRHAALTGCANSCIVQLGRDSSKTFEWMCLCIYDKNKRRRIPFYPALSS